MSNPVINRLGINQFWHKHWYSDSLYAENLHQDNTFTSLIQLYLNYGLTYSTNFFFHEYFYKNNLKAKRLIKNNKISSCRRFFYTNTALDIDHSYLLKNKTEEYFPMRLWLLKYMNWVIFSVQWFKPIKKKNNLKSNSLSYINSIHETGKPRHNLTRLKFIILLLSKHYKTSIKEYCF